MASLCTEHFPHHPNLRGTVALGWYPLQLTDLTLLRLCNDDLPRLDCSCGTGGLLALLLSLDLDSSGLLSQREVVLDRLRRSHRLAHLLLWNGRKEIQVREKKPNSATATVNFHSSPKQAMCSCLLNAELSTFAVKGKGECEETSCAKSN